MPPDLSAGATTVDGAAPVGKSSCTDEQQKQGQGQNQEKQSRKVYDVHPGSYAGEGTRNCLLYGHQLFLPEVAYLFCSQESAPILDQTNPLLRSGKQEASSEVGFKTTLTVESCSSIKDSNIAGFPGREGSQLNRSV